MPDYKNGRIYAIRSHQTDQIYIGSTTQTLAERLRCHKKIINTKNCSSKLILEHEDAYIELIELFPCNSREELNKKEGEHIRSNNCVNKNIAGRTKTEYQKEYEKDNKEKILEYKKQLRQRPENKEYHKQYHLKRKLMKKSLSLSIS